MGKRLIAGLCVLWAVACGGDDSPAQEPEPEPDEMLIDIVKDADADGLCDVTEQNLGSDPEMADTDGDGFPDVIEYYFGSILDTSGPLPADLVFLTASPGARVDREIRVTVDGEGEGHSGAFDALPSPYPDASAADFYAGALAVSAQPPDHVRGIEADAQRFGTVQGSTRLSFNLSFQYNGDIEPQPDCSAGYPFVYRVKAEGLGQAAQVYMLLVVAPPGLPADAGYCIPSSCI